MEETTTTETENTQTTWDEVAAASAAAAVEGDEPRTPPRHFTDKAFCKLTDDELRALGDTLEEALANVDTLTEEKKLAASGFKARIDLAKERVGEIRESLRSKKELRDVEMIESFDYRLGTASIIRVDTGELVTERALTWSERQPSLPGVPGLSPESDDTGDSDDAEEEELAQGIVDAAGNIFADDDAPSIEDPQAVLDGEPQEIAAKKRARRSKKAAS